MKASGVSCESALDANGHVNNQEYLRWMEEAAIEHSAAQGWPLERYLSCGLSWYVRSHLIEYLRPALLGDRQSPARCRRSTQGLPLAGFILRMNFCDSELARERRPPRYFSGRSRGSPERG